MPTKISNIEARTFSREGKIAEILSEVISAIPKHSQVWVIGGAARNAVYFEIFKKNLPQRDFDLVYVGNVDKFVNNLRKKRFRFGRIRRKEEVVLRKKLVDKPKTTAEYLFLDIHMSNEKSIIKNLEQNAAFTLNGFAIPLKKYLSKNLLAHTKSLPHALGDIKKKQLRLNPTGYKGHPGNLFACLRFMSAGFKAPKKEEVALLLKELPRLEEWRFERNVQKAFTYVGGEKKARSLVRFLGIKYDVFSFTALKRMR